MELRFGLRRHPNEPIGSFWVNKNDKNPISVNTATKSSESKTNKSVLQSPQSVDTLRWIPDTRDTSSSSTINQLDQSPPIKSTMIYNKVIRAIFPGHLTETVTRYSLTLDENEVTRSDECLPADVMTHSAGYNDLFNKDHTVRI
ncbi:hypothetical protein RUM44_004998 [Polyplax serrata]|uniref:Uncharacterized protein n=1 Tax=Polyplax serrata TaxID=468196 RepID=A0ABR1AYF6_POLSC